MPSAHHDGAPVLEAAVEANFPEVLAPVTVEDTTTIMSAKHPTTPRSKQRLPERTYRDEASACLKGAMVPSERSRFVGGRCARSRSSLTIDAHSSCSLLKRTARADALTLPDNSPSSLVCAWTRRNPMMGADRQRYRPSSSPSHSGRSSTGWPPPCGPSVSPACDSAARTLANDTQPSSPVRWNHASESHGSSLSG